MLVEPSEEAWSDRDIAGTGRALFERVPEGKRPEWAVGLVMHAGSRVQLPDLDLLATVGLDSARWREAEEIFGRLRERTLRNEAEGRGGSLEQLVLSLAEAGAKVIANAGGGLFDANAGWGLAPRLKAVSNEVKDEAFDAECWALLVRRMV